MRIVRSRRVVGGVVAAMLAAAGVFGVLAASSGAARPAAKPAAVPLGSVTALAWGVQTPVGARLVLRPSVSFNLQQRALRVLHARKPRLRGSFVARIATTPARGRGRTLVVVSQRVRGLAVRVSGARTILGGRLQLRGWTLTRRQTRAVKRAAARGPLALTFSARYRVSYTNARGRTVLTPTRSGSVTLPVALKPQTGHGGDLRKLAGTFRALLGRAGQLQTACVTRNTISEQLRNTYGVMVSGDRTSAAGLLQLYSDDAAGMQTAGLLSRGQASMLGSGLVALLKRVGSGHSKRVEKPRRWPALPACGPVRAHRAQTLIAIIVKRVAKRVYKVIKKRLKHHVQDQIKDQVKDKLVDEIKDNLWPQDTTQPSVNEEVPATDITQAEQALDTINASVDSFTTAEELYLATNPAEVAAEWDAALQAFAQQRWRFEPSTAYYTVNDEVQLLPPFAQFIDMYLPVLREGVLTGPKWGMTLDGTLSAEDKIRAELNPNGSTSGCTGFSCPGGDAMSYSKRVYDAGLAQLGSSTDPQTNFNKTNEYKREMQIGVLDLRDMWHLQDPMGYPFGEPGFKQNRMIYTDEVGTTKQTFAVPANVTNPLSAITAWTTPVNYGSHNNQNWLTAIKADNSPQTGARTGAASTGTPTTYKDIAPNDTGSYTTARGPIVQVDAVWDQKDPTTYPQKLASAVKFYFSNDSTAVPGGSFSSKHGSSTSFSYQDEVLAAAKIMGSYKMTSSGTYVGDAIVFGFKLADSFATQWQGSLPGALRAPNTQACLGVEQVTATSGTHTGTTTGSRAPGAPLQVRNCSSTAWDQTWLYIDYNDKEDPNDDVSQRELTVYGGTMCAAPQAGATTAGTPVQVYYCDATPAQKWSRNADGTITNDQSKLCLERTGGSASSGTPIQLNTCNGTDGQKWNWP